MWWPMNSCNEHGDPASPKNEMYFEAVRKPFKVSKRYPMGFSQEGNRFDNARAALEKLWRDYTANGYRAGPPRLQRRRRTTRNIDKSPWAEIDFSCNLLKLMIAPGKLVTWDEFTRLLNHVIPMYATPLAASIERASAEPRQTARRRSPDRRDLRRLRDLQGQSAQGPPKRCAPNTASRSTSSPSTMCDNRSLAAIANAGGGAFIENAVPDGFAASTQGWQSSSAGARRACAEAQTARQSPGGEAGRCREGRARNVSSGPAVAPGGAAETSFGNAAEPGQTYPHCPRRHCWRPSPATVTRYMVAAMTGHEIA